MKVNGDLCLGCEACIAVCPHDAIELCQGRAWINPSLCDECGACAEVCPQGAVQPAPDLIESNMPRCDRTGPFGLGHRTGRGLGYCAGFNAPGFTQPASGRGMAWGGCFRWRQRAYAPRSSWGIPRYAPPTKAETLQALRSEAA